MSHSNQPFIRSLLALLVLFSLSLRLSGLGRASLEVDEYLHVLSAQSWLARGSPLLPSGNRYDRALPYTAAVALAMRVSGRQDEASVRIPSVMAGTALILILYMVGRRWFGAACGCCAAALAAVHPLLVSTSRLCRMYSWFEVLYLLLIIAVWEGLCRPGLSWQRRTRGAVVSGLLLLIMLMIHKLSGVFLISFAVFLGGVGLLRLRSFETALLLIGAGVLAAAASLHWVDFQRVWHDFNYAPSWAQQSRYAARFYWDLWVRDLPLLLPIAPLLLVYLIWRWSKLGWYLTAMTVVPFALHSLIFDWKSPRYLSYVVAPLLLALSVGIVAIGRFAADCFGRHRLRALWVMSLLGAVVLGWPLGCQVRKSLTESATPAWRQACAYLAAHWQEQDIVLTDEPLALQYYTGKPAEYILNNYRYRDFSNRLSRDSEDRQIDWYSGRPHVTDEAAFLKLVAANPHGWLVMPRYNFEAAGCTPVAIRQWLIQHGKRHLPGADETMVVYSWQTRQSNS